MSDANGIAWTILMVARNAAAEIINNLLLSLETDEIIYARHRE
jgi:hypothetical protein